MSKHTFLLCEGYWKATGKFWDDKNNEYPVNGETLIRHLGAKWVNKGVMRIFAERSINFTNEYEIEPLASGKQETNWISNNSSIGHLHGTFKVEDDALISEYQSAKGGYRGSERFVYKTDNQYQVDGELFKGKSKISSWSVVLERQHQASSATHH